MYHAIIEMVVQTLLWIILIGIIVVDSTQTDRDTNVVEETNGSGNGLDPYEIVNAGNIIQKSSQNEVVEYDHSLNKWEVNLQRSLYWKYLGLSMLKHLILIQLWRLLTTLVPSIL